MLAPGRALICGATLGPITAIPQEKMARRDRESTGRKIRASTSGCDKARLVTRTRQAANETAAVACGRLLSYAPVVGRNLACRLHEPQIDPHPPHRCSHRLMGRALTAIEIPRRRRHGLNADAAIAAAEVGVVAAIRLRRGILARRRAGC